MNARDTLVDRVRRETAFRYFVVGGVLTQALNAFIFLWICMGGAP